MEAFKVKVDFKKSSSGSRQVKHVFKPKIVKGSYIQEQKNKLSILKNNPLYEQ